MFSVRLKILTVYGANRLTEKQNYPRNYFIQCQLLIIIEISEKGSKTMAKIAEYARLVLTEEYLDLPPFSLIRDFGKQNTCGNVSKIPVSLACY